MLKLDRGTPNIDQVQENTWTRQRRRTVTHVQCWCGVSKLVLLDAQYFEREAIIQNLYVWVRDNEPNQRRSSGILLGVTKALSMGNTILQQRRIDGNPQ